MHLPAYNFISMCLLLLLLLVIALMLDEVISFSVNNIDASSLVLDKCNAEPHLNITHMPSGELICNSTTRTLLIDVQKLHGNPYHSLYDTAWAVSHYLQSCLRAPHSTQGLQNTKIYLKTNYLMDMTRCEVEPKIYNRWQQPSWGACVLRAAALREKIPESNIIVSPEDPPDCFHDRVVFHAHFRSMQYRIGPFKPKRNDTLNKRRGRRRRKKAFKQYLPSYERDQAFRNLAEAPFLVHQSEVGTALSSSGVRSSPVWMGLRPRVHILIYDRRDQKPHRLKRKWQNAADLVEHLHTDERVKVQYISEMPKSLLAQATLFRWADILVAPHGAAMANTIFMREGAHIFEIHKCCKQEVRTEPNLPRRWTGWHADKMGINLSYLQCHRVNESLSVEELAAVNAEKGPEADQWCRLPWFDVAREELFRRVDDVLERQASRVAEFRGHGSLVRKATSLNVFVVAGLLSYRLFGLILRKLRQ